MTPYLGYGQEKKKRDAEIRTVGGLVEKSYVVEIERLEVLGKTFESIEVAASDFRTWADDGIDGLLGWEIIRQLHVEMDGPHGLFKIY